MRMVSVLQEACYGNFMCTEDQQESRRDTLDQERVLVGPVTNYEVSSILYSWNS